MRRPLLLEVLVSSTSRGLAPREGLELLMLKLGRTWPSEASLGTLVSRTPTVNVGFQIPQTLKRFELWGACGDLNLPSLPTHNPHSLVR